MLSEDADQSPAGLSQSAQKDHFNITIIQVYAPTSGHIDEEFDHFYYMYM